MSCLGPNIGGVNSRLVFIEELYGKHVVISKFDWFQSWSTVVIYLWNMLKEREL